MELSEELLARRLVPEIEWAPRELNMEADALSRGITEGFTDGHRVEVNFSSIEWHILPEALRWGEELNQAKSAAKESRGRPDRRRAPHPKRRKEDKLRVRDPWVM